MKQSALVRAVAAAVLLLSAAVSRAQNPENWIEKQLMAPAALAAAVEAGEEQPVIVSVGPGGVIPNSVGIGMVNTPEGLAKYKAYLAGLPKDRKVVVYCGCCPFAHCPNARPAVAALQEMQFTNYYLLDLPHNIKQDWIDKGYPVVRKKQGH